MVLMHGRTFAPKTEEVDVAKIAAETLEPEIAAVITVTGSYVYTTDAWPDHVRITFKTPDDREHEWEVSEVVNGDFDRESELVQYPGQYDVIYEDPDHDLTVCEHDLGGFFLMIGQNLLP